MIQNARALNYLLVLATVASVIGLFTPDVLAWSGLSDGSAGLQGIASDSRASSNLSEGSFQTSEGSSEASGGSVASSEGSSETSQNSSESSQGSSDSSEATSGSSQSSESESEPDPQTDTDTDEDSTVNFAIVATSAFTAVATTAGVIVLTVIYINNAAAELYLRGNSVALRYYLRRGAGDTLNDLAHLCGIPTVDFPQFAAALHRHREALLIHIDSGNPIEADVTQAFLRALAEIIMDDPHLTDSLLTRQMAQR